MALGANFVRLEQGSDEEGMGDDDDEDRVMYKNHQVHHNVINHSQANRTQEVVDSRWAVSQRLTLTAVASVKGNR